jgi:hypothetical protein
MQRRASVNPLAAEIVKGHTFGAGGGAGGEWRVVSGAWVAVPASAAGWRCRQVPLGAVRSRTFSYDAYIAATQAGRRATARVAPPRLMESMDVDGLQEHTFTSARFVGWT